jgi:predicted HicB family RNase H-like nuclease
MSDKKRAVSYLDPKFHKKVKLAAQAHDLSISQFIEMALKQHMTHEPARMPMRSED